MGGPGLAVKKLGFDLFCHLTFLDRLGLLDWSLDWAVGLFAGDEPFEVDEGSGSDEFAVFVEVGGFAGFRDFEFAVDFWDGEGLALSVDEALDVFFVEADCSSVKFHCVFAGLGVDAGDFFPVGFL